jgi:translocon-associated protein subunit alpha
LARYYCRDAQPGSFALVASILYEVDGQAFRNVFYNGTIEVVESSGFVSGETIFLVTLGIGMLGLLGMWAYGQFVKISKVCYL